MKKNFLGKEIDTKPHKIARELVAYMLEVNRPLSIEQLTDKLSETNTLSNLETRVNRCLTNTPEIVNERSSEQSRIFSIPLNYKNIEIFQEGDKFLLKLSSGDAPVIRETNYTNDDLTEYVRNKKEKHNHLKNEELYKLKEDFLKEWPIDRLKSITLEEYTNLEKTSFCYWLEHITRDLGSIVGGSSYKFGIYKRNSSSEVKEESNRTTDGEYAWFKKYGEESKEEAFETVKSIIIKIANAAQNNTLEVIDAIDLGNAYKWKIAFLYGAYNCVNMFKLDALRVIASNLEIKYNNKTPISYFHKAILELKPQEEGYFAYCHALWKQYQERLIDVKKDFAKWLNINTFESYRRYLGNTNKSIEEKLDEINAFFDEVDFFLVDPKKVNGVVSTIQFLMSKKERVKNPEFLVYDAKNSNGIPKAILGKNNYLKFLKEKFEYKTPNYWIFQGNPKVYDFETGLRHKILTDWTVSAHKNKIKIGDKIILWITGSEAGCYALAEVTYNPRTKTKSANDYLWKEEDKNELKAGLKITHNFVDTPILKESIAELEEFKDFKAGNQGSNFSATEEEFETLLNWNPNSTKNTFQKTRAKLDTSIFDEYIDFVRSIINSLGLKPQDSRIVYSVRGSSLNFTIGQKYCINVYTSKNKESFGIISTRKISDNNEEYAGKTPQTYYNYVSKLDFNKDEQKTIIEAIKAVLKKTIKSGYYKSNDADFENYLFGIESINKKENRMTEATNQILYGPPGTGKTFYFKKELFDKYTISETAVSQEKYFENIVSECTWFQVIAMALIELGKSKVSDIIKNRWVLQKTEMSNAKSIRPIAWGKLQYHTLDSCEFVNLSSKSNITVFTKDADSYWEISENDAKEQIPEVYELIEKVTNFIPNPDIEIKNYEFITFHQSYSYEDFIEGIKPVMSESETSGDSAIGYQIQDGVFKKLCLKATKNPSERYAIFIDEINRGNVSAIFGELITLIEQDKRQGEANEISVQLPYSKALFSVPANIDIYGTMNTADRSVEALDTALRRRFSFLEMMPDPSLLKDNEVEGMNLKEVLNTINDRIEILIDRDHTIGHSYFMNIKTTEALRLAFKDKIVPLLQEYFYGDYGKIGLVLGDGFVKSHSKSNNPFANFKYEGKEELNRDFFDLVAINDKFDIKKAIETLLNNAKDN
tara:strand:+ start:219 stop:3701 length:3483 start_codon:yes stop_codon:yes gene_type:complete